MMSLTEQKIKEMEEHAKKRLPENGVFSEPIHRLANDCLSLIKELKDKAKKKSE